MVYLIFLFCSKKKSILLSSFNLFEAIGVIYVHLKIILLILDYLLRLSRVCQLLAYINKKIISIKILNYKIVFTNLMFAWKQLILVTWVLLRFSSVLTSYRALQFQVYINIWCCSIVKMLFHAGGKQMWILLNLCEEMKSQINQSSFVFLCNWRFF